MERIHNRFNLIELIRVKKQEDFPSFKPNGFWYAADNEWIKWCRDCMPNWEGNINYKVIIPPECNLLILDSKEKLIEFTKEFGIKNNCGITFINWNKVAQKYDGTEIIPYFRKLRFKLDWYYDWDVASGCLWNGNFKVELI